LSPITNIRDDEWGGDEQRRMRFVLEVVRAIRREVGAAFPIGVKLNSADFQRGGFDHEASMRVVEALGAEGIDLLEVSGGTYERAVMMGQGERASTAAREAYFIDYARDVRARTPTPIMLTGGFRSAGAMADAVQSGATDVVGMGRPLTVEPDLPRALLAGASAGSDLTPKRIGIRRIDGVVEIAWHTMQMHRLAAGRAPAPGRSPLRAMLRTVTRDGINSVRRVRG
jgi:2,4-dienoyl-CoA reductase-like NADH-dependent reductase (Old Yellow Enzyme family)